MPNTSSCGSSLNSAGQVLCSIPFHVAGKGEHPVVLISHTDFCAQSIVNVLYCTSQRQSRPPKPYEVMLNGADGMDWETFCDCSRIPWGSSLDFR